MKLTADEQINQMEQELLDEEYKKVSERILNTMQKTEVETFYFDELGKNYERLEYIYKHINENPELLREEIIEEGIQKVYRHYKLIIDMDHMNLYCTSDNNIFGSTPIRFTRFSIVKHEKYDVEYSEEYLQRREVEDLEYEREQLEREKIYINKKLNELKEEGEEDD